MQILVAVKQVPDPQGRFRIGPDGRSLAEEGLVFRMNSYDTYAVEEAVRIKERLGPVEITAVSVGPARAEAVVRRALELGADHGIHLLAAGQCCPDAMETAFRIASFARDRGFDLLLFGVMSEDKQRYQTGPMTAALLDLPCATTVVALALEQGRGPAVVERELEGGIREVVEMPLPCVLTVQSGINRPRYPSLTNKLRARKQAIPVIDVTRTPIAPRCQERIRLTEPPASTTGTFLEGSVEEQAEALVRILHEKTDLL